MQTCRPFQTGRKTKEETCKKLILFDFIRTLQKGASLLCQCPEKRVDIINTSGITIHTVDGSEIPNNHLRWCKNPVKSWDFNYQPQLVSLPDFFQPSTVSVGFFSPINPPCNWWSSPPGRPVRVPPPFPVPDVPIEANGKEDGSLRIQHMGSSAGFSSVQSSRGPNVSQRSEELGMVLPLPRATTWLQL